MQDEKVLMYLVLPEFKPGNVQILVTEDESDVILVKFHRIIKSVNDLLLKDGKYFCPFDFLIDLSSHNVKFIKVVAIVTTTEHFEKEGWILNDETYLQSLLHGLWLRDIRSPLQTSIKQSNVSISQSWPLKSPISLNIIASTEPSRPLFSLLMEAEEEVVINSIDIVVMNGIVGEFQEGKIVLKPKRKYHWSFGISFLDSCTKLIANFNKNSRESQHVLKSNNSVLNIQIFLNINGIDLVSNSKALLDFNNLYNTLEPLKTLEILNGNNVTGEVVKQALHGECQIFFTCNNSKTKLLAPTYIYTRQIFSIQVYIVNTSSRERNFILKIPNSKSCIVCLEDSIRIRLFPHKSFFLNLHFVSLEPCNATIDKFELYDMDLESWIDLVNVLRIITL